MRNQTKEERQRVFSTYREVFTGDTARVRKKKAIRSIVQKHSLSSKVLLGDREIEKLVPIHRALLHDRVFESEELASKEFPELVPGPSKTIGLISPERVTSVKREQSREPQTWLERPIEAKYEGLQNAPRSTIPDIFHGMFYPNN